MATNNIAAPRAAVRKRILERCMIVLIRWAVPVGGSSSHGDPFGQHCGDGRGPCAATRLKQPAALTPRSQRPFPRKKRPMRAGRRLAPRLEHDKRGSTRQQGQRAISMGIATALFAVAAAAIVTAWAWLGAAVQMPSSPLAPGEKLYCVSYTPFRGTQSPFGPDIPVDPRQIDEDLARLKHITDCVRTYSVDFGLDQIAEIAKRHGMKVLQGLWLSNRPELSRKQVATAIALANRFPDVIAAVIVGNEVLLRGEMAAADLVRTIREVKAQVPVPVTYADVWEFWLRHRDVATAVDFVTIHILPYWEDFPI